LIKLFYFYTKSEKCKKRVLAKCFGFSFFEFFIFPFLNFQNTFGILEFERKKGIQDSWIFLSITQQENRKTKSKKGIKHNSSKYTD
jgi:hypothetical protein